jgi:hypothetical protein
MTYQKFIVETIKKILYLPYFFHKFDNHLQQYIIQLCDY